MEKLLHRAVNIFHKSGEKSFGLSVSHAGKNPAISVSELLLNNLLSGTRNVHSAAEETEFPSITSGSVASNDQ